MACVPGELIWTMTNKIVSATAGPDFMQRGFINIVHSQQRQRLKLMVTHALTHIRRILHSTPELFFSGEVQLAQQALFPAIPQGFVGRADVRDGQADQKTQPCFGLHLFGELLDDFRITDVAALGGD